LTTYYLSSFASEELEDETDADVAAEAKEIATSLERFESRLELAPLRILDEVTHPSDHPRAAFTTQKFETLVTLRREHQTRQAATCTRTTLSAPCVKSKNTVRQALIREMNEIVHNSQERAVGTGL
jgi:hypothetical protein